MKYWSHSVTLVENCTPIIGTEGNPSGCLNCWSAAMAHQYKRGQTNKDGKWTGDVRIREDRLPELSKGRKPRVIQIWNDTYHEKVSDDFLYQAYSFMLYPPNKTNHTYLVLTKRAKRMSEFLINLCTEMKDEIPDNVWHGVTAENQQRADERIPYLLQVPGKRWLSIEPLLENIDISRYLLYNEMYESTLQGKRDLRSGEDEAFRNHARRHNMEDSGIKRQQMEQPNGITKDQEKASRTRSGAISSNILEGDVLHGSPFGMETFQWGDTNQQEYKSQEWQKERQFARESGISNGIGKYETCISDRTKGRNRRKKSELQINKCSDRGCSYNLCCQSEDSNADSENVQCILPNSVENCKRRKSNKTERHHGRLYPPTSEDKDPKKQERTISACVVGCETGRNARLCKIEWLESIVEQCREAGVPCFVKAINLNGKITSDITKFPENVKARNLVWKR